MGIYCVAYGCKNRQMYVDKNISFHRFPHNRATILEKWIAAVRRKNWQPTRYSRLCSDHFTEDSYQFRPGAPTKLLKEDAVPSIFNFPHLNRKKKMRRKLMKSAMETETSSKKQVERSDNEPMKTRHSLRKITLQASTQSIQDEQEEDMINEEKIAAKEERIIEEEMVLNDGAEGLAKEPLTYETLFMYYWAEVTLPSTLWAVHRDTSGKFIAFSYISDNTSGMFVSTDKVVMFEGSLNAEIFVRGRKIDPSFSAEQNVETIETMGVLLKEVDELELCKGTGLEIARYSPECYLFLDRKYRNSRCSNCALKRTHLKKTEAQRLRRAAAKQKEPSKNVVEYHRQPRKEELEFLGERSDTEDYFDEQNNHFTVEGDNEHVKTEHDYG